MVRYDYYLRALVISCAYLILVLEDIYETMDQSIKKKVPYLV